MRIHIPTLSVLPGTAANVDGRLTFDKEGGAYQRSLQAARAGKATALAH